MKPFHLSIGSKSIDDSVHFFTEVLPGKVTHRDESGYVNLEVFGAQITLKDNPTINPELPELPELPDFHFGFNLSLSEFNDLATTIADSHRDFVTMEPKVIDGGTPMERNKMYLRSPTGYVVELKGYK